MKLLLLLPLLSFAAIGSLSATHNTGGSVTYRHVSGTTYEATITTFTETRGVSADADRDSLELDWGDGTIEFVLRSSIEPQPDSARQINRYTATHTYAQDGQYRLGMVDRNRTASIVNIENSVNEAFVLTSDLTVDVDMLSNSSPRFLTPLLYLARAGEPIEFAIGGTDADGDILIYSLDTPLGLGYTEVDYTLPAGVRLTPTGGQFSWTPADNLRGTFAFAVEVSEFRDGEGIGSVVREFVVVVNEGPGFTGGGDVGLVGAVGDDGYGQQVLHVAPGDQVDLEFAYTPGSGNVDLLSLAGFSESSTTVTGGEFQPAVDADVLRFTWTPTVDEARCAAYPVIVRATEQSDGHQFVYDASVMVYVREGNGAACDDAIAGAITSSTARPLSQQQARLHCFPNPTVSELHIRLSTDEPATRSYSVRVYDLTGRRRLEHNLGGSEAATISLRDFTAGSYVGVLVDGSGNAVDRVPFVVLDAN